MNITIQDINDLRELQSVLGDESSKIIKNYTIYLTGKIAGVDFTQDQKNALKQNSQDAYNSLQGLLDDFKTKALAIYQS